MEGLIQDRLGAYQFRTGAVGGDALRGVGEGRAGGSAPHLEIVEGGAQLEEGRALAAGEIEGGGDVSLAGTGIGVSVGAQP